MWNRSPAPSAESAIRPAASLPVAPPPPDEYGPPNSAVVGYPPNGTARNGYLPPGYGPLGYGPQGYGPGALDPMAKSKLAAGLLGIFLGAFGAHRFYLGFTRRGVIMLLVTFIGGVLTLGIASVAMSIWGLVEGIMYLSGSPNYSADSTGRPLR